MKKLIVFALAATLSVSALAADKKAEKKKELPKMEKAKAVTTLEKKDTKEGTGIEAKKGTHVTVHYTGWLREANGEKGKKFDSSVDRGQTFSFDLGAGQVIRGWDEGVQGMKEGGQRTLTIPSEMGYGARGAGNAIPPNATLIFDVELIKVN